MKLKNRAPIRAADWLDLRCFDIVGWPPDAVGVKGEDSPRHLEVRVPAAQVKELWRAENAEGIRARNRPAHRARDARIPTISALLALYPPSGDPGQEKLAAVTARVNAELKRAKGKAVSETTVRRARKDLRDNSMP